MNKSINEFLSKVKFESIANLTEYVYYNYIKEIEAEEQIINNLISFFEWNFLSDKSFNISDSVSDKDYTENFDKAAGILKTNIDNLIEQEVEERDFYINLWNTISNTSLFVSDEDRIGALFYLENSDKVPYFKLEKPVAISGEEFDSLFDELNMDLQKCMFICNRGYKYRTEVASQLLRIIDGQSDEKHRIILLVRILHYLEWTFTNAGKSEEEESVEEQSEEHKD